MAGKCLHFCLLIVVCLVHNAEALLTPSETFLGSQALVNDDIYHVYWNYNTSHITFEVHVKVRGWVGFGLSPNGGMAGSDIVIGWVQDGRAFFTDRYASGDSMPTIDEQQDWILLFANETSTHTILKFVRKLKTCDFYDRDVTANTLRVIFAYSETDPSSEDSVTYHGSKRGVRSMMLLSLSRGEAKMPNDAFYVDLQNENVSIPHMSDTTYWCTGFKAPDFTEKHHLIKIEPIIQAGNEALVHHMILYACYHTPEKVATADTGFICYTPNMPWGECNTIILIWGTGGTAFTYPEHVGMPFGEPEGGILYLRLEVHYDNPSLTPGIVDSSGFRLWFTKTLRTYDAGLLTTGMKVNPRVQILPAGYDNLTMHGHCVKECLSEGMGAESSIKVFSTAMHTHLLGTGVRVHHYRDGVELPFLDSDPTYDFNFQQFRTFSPERTILKGDELIVECVYNTSSRKNTSYGGLGTREEMCLAFLFYYPRVKVAGCMSNPTQENMARGLSLSFTKRESRFGSLALLNDFSGQPFHRYMSRPGVLSNTTLKHKYQKSLLSGEFRVTCEHQGTLKSSSDRQLRQVPAIASTYSVPDTCISGAQTKNIAIAPVLLIAVITLSAMV